MNAWNTFKDFFVEVLVEGMGKILVVLIAIVGIALLIGTIGKLIFINLILETLVGLNCV